MAMCASRLRALLVGTLIVSLHSSVCTGGIFSVTAALAGHLGTDTVTAGFFSPDTLLCQLFTPVSAAEEAHAVADAPPQAGCDDSEFCLQNAARGAKEEVPLLTNDPVPLPLPAVLSQPATGVIVHGRIFASARDGPMYADAPYLAGVLLKRE